MELDKDAFDEACAKACTSVHSYTKANVDLLRAGIETYLEHAFSRSGGVTLDKAALAAARRAYWGSPETQESVTERTVRAYLEHARSPVAPPPEEPTFLDAHPLPWNMQDYSLFDAKHRKFLGPFGSYDALLGGLVKALNASAPAPFVAGRYWVKMASMDNPEPQLFWMRDRAEMDRMRAAGWTIGKLAVPEF